MSRHQLENILITSSASIPTSIPISRPRTRPRPQHIVRTLHQPKTKKYQKIPGINGMTG